jgi:hypothetical protein
VLAALGREFRMKAEVNEGVDMGAGDDVDRAAVTAVAATRPAARDELLAAERQTPAPAVPRFNVNVDFVDENTLTPAEGC